MRTLISIFILPQEIDDLENTINQLSKSIKYRQADDEIFLDVTIGLSDYLTDWSNSKLPKEVFIDKYTKISDAITWCEKRFNIDTTTDVLGCVSQRRSSWKLGNDMGVDNYIWLDVDLIFDELTLPYMIHAAKSVGNPKYIITPQTVKLWDRTWDCLVHSDFMDKPYGYERNGCDPYIDSGIKGDVSISEITSGVSGQPLLKFAGGWFTLISKEVLDIIGVPDELGHYGLEDTFIMWANEVGGYGISQYRLNNAVVCENYKYRNLTHYIDNIEIISRKDEFLTYAQRGFNFKLNELSNRMNIQ